MKIWCISILCTFALFVTVQRSPAPIVEEEKPTPTPASTQTPKEKKSLIKSRGTSQLKQASSATPKQKASVTQKRFAGTWVGTIPAFPTGPQETRLTIDPSETVMQQEWIGHGQATARTEISGDTIRATFREGVTYTWSLTPVGDGTIGQARLQAFMNDQTAIFHRVAPSASAR